MRFIYIILAIITAATISGCRDEEYIVLSETVEIEEALDVDANPEGFYLINEGNMGSNKATIDYMDYTKGAYTINIYSERNPNTVKELGDVGNDIAIYNGKLYAVINASHKVEIMDADSAIRVTQVDIPNCRSLAYDGDYVYVSSYVAPVGVSSDSETGAVYRINASTNQLIDNVTVGYQPEEMVIKDGYLYVANSGGYRTPDYDNTVSVIRLSDFKQIAMTEVAINLSFMQMDSEGKIWVVSRGNYSDIASKLYYFTVNSSGAIDNIVDPNIECSNFAISGNLLYLYSAQQSLTGGITSSVSYKIIETTTATVIDEAFIKDGSDSSIKTPYSIDINPESGEIIINDAKNYVSSGTVNCYTTDGKLKWQTYAGDIPSKIAFKYR